MKKNIGFTLIELLIAVVIVGLLSAIAIPSYNEYVLKSRRTEAQALLLEMAGKQVRFHSENNTYASAVGDLGYGAAGATSYESESASYDVSVTAADAASFSLTAAPKNAQSSDDCGSLSYNSAGQKSVSGTASVADCW